VIEIDRGGEGPARGDASQWAVQPHPAVAAFLSTRRPGVIREKVSVRFGVSFESPDAAGAVAALGALVQRGVEELHRTGLLTHSVYSLQILDPRRRHWPRRER